MTLGGVLLVPSKRHPKWVLKNLGGGGSFVRGAPEIVQFLAFSTTTERSKRKEPFPHVDGYQFFALRSAPGGIGGLSHSNWCRSFSVSIYEFPRRRDKGDGYGC